MVRLRQPAHWSPSNAENFHVYCHWRWPDTSLFQDSPQQSGRGSGSYCGEVLPEDGHFGNNRRRSGALELHRGNHTVASTRINWNTIRTGGGGHTAKVRNASTMGRQLSILELRAIPLISLRAFETFLLDWHHLTVTPAWTRTLKNALHPSCIPQEVARAEYGCQH